jgi:hypothetical protein
MYSGQILRFSSISASGGPLISVCQLPTDAAGINTFSYISSTEAQLDFQSGGWVADPPGVSTSNIFYHGSTSSYVLVLRFLIYN